MSPVEWVVEYTDEFEVWWDSLSEAEQEDIGAVVTVLGRTGPRLPRPYSDTVKQSKHPNLRF
jgi:hypothetical protein